MKNLIKEEVPFYGNCAESMSPNISPERKRLIEDLYGLDHGGPRAFVNDCMRRLIKAIQKRRMSIANFTIEDAECIRMLLDAPNLDEELQLSLSHHLYGADERKKYLS